MTTETNTAAADAGGNKSKSKKTPLDIYIDLESRRVFPSFADATPYIQEAAAKAEAAGVRVLAFSADPEAWPTEGYEIIVERLSNRKDGVNVQKALIVWPIPTIDTLWEVNRETVEFYHRTEMAHRLKRHIRDEELTDSAIKRMPRDASEFGAAGGASRKTTAVFNAVGLDALNTLKANIPALARFNLTKGEFRKCMESAPYALKFYKAIEEKGIFVKGIEVCARIAKTQGEDISIFETWAATRDQQTVDSDESLDDFDMEALENF